MGGKYEKCSCTGEQVMYPFYVTQKSPQPLPHKYYKFFILFLCGLAYQAQTAGLHPGHTKYTFFLSLINQFIADL